VARLEQDFRQVRVVVVHSGLVVVVVCGFVFRR
jgi:hypothetical protein